MRKGQVSAFIIIGLIILTIISLVLFTISNIKETDIKIQEKIVGLEIDESLVEIQIQTCLENVSNNMLFLMAKNGGYLNKSFVNSKIINGVSYSKLIDQSEKKFNLSFSKTPEYPCPTQDDVTDRCSKDKKAKCYFKVNADTVCDLGFFSTPAKEDSYFNDSFTQQLNEHGYKAMNSCLGNLTNLTIEENIKFSTIIQEDNVYFSYQFPIQINTSRKASTKEIFEYSAPAKLNLIRNIIVDSVAAESKRFDYDLESELKERIANHASLELEYLKDININQDTLIKIKDNEFALNDSLFSYEFIVENRPPALETVQSDAIYPSDRVNEINYYVTVGKYITIKPVAHDPDNDTLFFTYSGWKADYDEEFNSSKAMNPDIFRSPLVYDPSIEANPKKTSLNKNIWQTSDFYNRTKREARILLEDKDVGVHEFTVSVSDGVYTDSQLVRVIVGPAPLPVITLRNLLFKDSSNVDLNDTYISIENPFHLNSNESDTSGIGASRNWWVNDVYYGSSEKFALPKSEIQANSEINSIIEKNSIIGTVSRDIDSHENLIQDIKQLNQEFLKVDDLNEIRLQLILDGSDVSRSTKHTFAVNKCNGFKSNYAMWPFNRLGSSRISLSNSRNPRLSSSLEVSPFYADSICCVQTQFGFEYADTSTECINADYQASPFLIARDLESATNKIGKEIILDSSTESKLTGGIGFLRSNVTNDIVQHKFTNYCSGNRGNICSGTNIHEIDFDNVIISCDTDTKSFTDNEVAKVVQNGDKELFAINNRNGNRCQGSISNNGANRFVLDNRCYNYEDETFEEIVHKKLSNNQVADIIKGSIGGSQNFSSCNQQIAFACVYNTTNGKTLLNVNKLNNPIHQISNEFRDGEYRTTYYYEGNYTCGDGFCHKPKGTVSSCPPPVDRCDLVNGELKFNSTYYSCNENGDINSPCKANSELIDGYNLVPSEDTFSQIGEVSSTLERRYSVSKQTPLWHCGNVGAVNEVITRCGAGEVFNGSTCINVCEETNNWYLDQANWNKTEYTNLSSIKLTTAEVEYFRSINYPDIYYGIDQNKEPFCAIPMGPGICSTDVIVKQSGQIFNNLANQEVCIGQRVLPNLAAFLNKPNGESCEYNSDCWTGNICKDIGSYNICVNKQENNKCFSTGSQYNIGDGSNEKCQYYHQKFNGIEMTKKQIINAQVISSPKSFEFFNQEIHCPEYDYTLFEKSSIASLQDRNIFLNGNCNCDSNLCNDYNDEFGARSDIRSFNIELENNLAESKNFIYFSKAEVNP